VLLHGLTTEQQDFAERNHNLIYSYLRDKRLPMNDFYDVIVFGYLRAVCQYCDRPDLRQRYTFGTIAYRKMTDDLYKHFRQQSCPSRRAIIISLDTTDYDDSGFDMADIVSNMEETADRVESMMLWEQVSALLSKEQIRLLRMRADGYTDREIADKRNRRVSEIKDLFAEIQAAALSLCRI